jgi:hypothetical protein
VRMRKRMGPLVLGLLGLCGSAAAAPSVSGERLFCSELLQSFGYAEAKLTSAAVVAPTAALPEHCLVRGKLSERLSPVDGQTYAIGFEMRMPTRWNGRFFYQANGGLDGVIVPALGAVSGGGPLNPALAAGFAVISSDAGHSAAQNPLFGIDPQARLDYGYQAVGKLTPMAKSLIQVAYGKRPDHSYIGGCSNGGRHVLVAASRYADQFDGFLAGDPGLHLPKAAVAQLYGAQQFSRLATSADLETAFTAAERKLVAERILQRCDRLDGLDDGMVLASAACQRRFSLARDVPTCKGVRNGDCLDERQKQALHRVFAGARNGAGKRLYAPFPYDPGIAGRNWAEWKFVASVTNRDPLAIAFIFRTPPVAADALKEPDVFGRSFALSFDFDRDTAHLTATDGLYTEASVDFMTPPDETRLTRLAQAGGKLIVYHGTADPVFSSDDTARWYRRIERPPGSRTKAFARYFEVPGMNHCRGGPATDQFDMITPLVEWVENGLAPERITASTRGSGNPGGANPELPTAWPAHRSRPLCPYPEIARYDGQGDANSAANFNCSR